MKQGRKMQQPSLQILFLCIILLLYLVENVLKLKLFPV